MLRIDRDQSDSIIRGRAPPGARIEAINLSAIPHVRRRPEETAIIAVAGDDGRFCGSLPMVERDLVRVRARLLRGRLLPWISFRARVPGTSPRPLAVALPRIALRDQGGGRVRAFSINPSRPIAEPGACLRIENARTKESIRVVLARGNLPAGLLLPGREGDTLILFDERTGLRIGRLRVPPKTPRGTVRPGRYHRTIGFHPAYQRFDGRLFRGPPKPEDVLQSELPDCYLASAATALAHTHQRALKSIVRPLGRGRFRVKLKTYVPSRNAYRTDSIDVTSELYVRPCGLLLYGSGAVTKANDQTPLWWPILEKAFAAWRGGYDVLGLGGTPHRVFEAVLGARPRHFFISPGEGEKIWREITSALADGRPLAVVTAGKESTLKYRNTGIYPNHSYAIIGAREAGGGARRIELRNPWGECTPREDGRVHSGYFEIAFDRFLELFVAVSTIAPGATGRLKAPAKTATPPPAFRARRRRSDGDSPSSRTGGSRSRRRRGR